MHDITTQLSVCTDVCCQVSSKQVSLTPSAFTCSALLCTALSLAGQGTAWLCCEMPCMQLTCVPLQAEGQHVGQERKAARPSSNHGKAEAIYWEGRERTEAIRC